MPKIVIQGRVNGGKWASIALAYYQIYGPDKAPKSSSSLLGRIVDDVFLSLIKDKIITSPVPEEDVKKTLSNLGYKTRETNKERRDREHMELSISPEIIPDDRIRKAKESLEEGVEQEHEDLEFPEEKGEKNEDSNV